MAYDLKRPETWTPHLRKFAWEAIRNQRLHKARAKRLTETGIAVMFDDGRCVVKIPAMDALFATMRSNVEVTGTAAALSPEAPLERRVGPGAQED